MKTFHRVSIVLLLALNCHGASDVKPQILRKPEHVNSDIGYSQAVRVGNQLYVSGSVGAGEMPVAMKQAYETIRATLETYGLGFPAVFKENVYTTKLDEFIAHKSIRKTYYTGEYPSATWVEVKRLYLPEFVVEIEVVAIIPDGK